MEHRTRVRIAFLIGLVLFWDVSTFIANSIQADSERIAELEAELAESFRVHEENEALYAENLMHIAKTLYEREQYTMGGFETPEGADVTAIYDAIMNYSEDYRGLLSIMGNYFDEREEFLASVPSIWPVEFDELTRITSAFGWRVSPITGELSFHTGLDIAGTYNSRVIAPADGVVIEHWVPPGGMWRGHDTFGGMVKIEHAGGFETVYAHLKWTNPDVIHEGNEIKQGDFIGIMGNTGRSRGQHLHYEVWLNGEPVNPLDYLRF